MTDTDTKDLFERTVLPWFEESRADWLANAREVALQLGEWFPEVTIDDVRILCPPPANVDPRVMGAVFLRKHWELLRHERSNRAACHNRPVGVFRRRADAR